MMRKMLLKILNWKVLGIVCFVLAGRLDSFAQEPNCKFQGSICKENRKGISFAIMNIGSEPITMPCCFQSMKKDAYVLEFGEIVGDTLLIRFDLHPQLTGLLPNATIQDGGKKCTFSIPLASSISVFVPRKSLPKNLNNLTVWIDNCGSRTVRLYRNWTK